MFGWLKENRRIGTRYDKLASSFSHGHAGLQPTLYAAILFVQNLAGSLPLSACLAVKDHLIYQILATSVIAKMVESKSLFRIFLDGDADQELYSYKIGLRVAVARLNATGY